MAHPGHEMARASRLSAQAASVGIQKQVILTSNSGIVLSKLLMMEVNYTLYSSHIVYSLSNLSYGWIRPEPVRSESFKL